MRNFTLLWLLLVVTPACAVGQTAISVVPIAQPEKASSTAVANPNYSAEPLVIEHVDHVYTMASDGTGSELITVAARVQSDAMVRQFGVVTVAFASSSQRVEIAYVRVRRPDGSVTATPATEAIEMPSPVTTAAPFYSDLKQMQIPVRNLRVGDRLEWQARIIRTKPEAPGHFWGQESFVTDAVALSETVELHVPKQAYVNVWSPAHKPTESLTDLERVFRWETSQRKPTVGAEADAERERKKKQVLTAEEELEEQEGKLPDLAWTNFRNWEEVGAWYQSLEADRVAPDAEVKAKVAELVSGRSSEEEKVQAVYTYVASQIRYIGVAFGIGRYQPHKASEVLENQYGDCKDKHTLLASMLNVLGLHPNAVLIGAGVQFNDAVPSPASFNHLITTVAVNGQTIWLDATAEVAPYRALMYPIRDKRVLVVPDTGIAKVDRSPADFPFAPFERMEATGSLDKDGISHSRLVLTLRGDEELFLRGALRQVSSGHYDELMQQVSRGMGYAGTVSHTEATRPEDTAEPLKISYDYEREKAGDWENRRIVPQLAPVQLPRVDEKEPPVRSIQLGLPRIESSTSAMKLPDGWGAELPEAIHAKSPWVTYDETYKFDKGTVYAERKVVILQQKVPVADWKAYKKWADQADLGSEQYIQLTGVTAKASPEKDGSSSDDTPGLVDAAKLIQAANLALQRHDLKNAQTLLDQVRTKNETQPMLWATYGYLDMLKGDIPSTIVEYKKEIVLHPAEYGVYKSLAETENIFNRRQDAKETIRQWMTAQPDSAEPAKMLASMLIEDNDAAAAVATAEKAIARIPEDEKKDEGLRLVLGKAEIKAGMKDKGAATLLAVLQTTEDPGMLNDSAYELAEVGAHLQEAESATKKALDKLETQSQSWTLDENPQVLNQKSHLILAAWDTMGWILFREGKLDLARSFVKAAWLNEQSEMIGTHLGEIEAAKGNKAAALQTYEQALATFVGYDAMGVRKAPGAPEKDLSARIEELRKAGTKSTAKAGMEHKFLQELRTVSLGAAGGVSGTAEYRLLLSAGLVEKVEKSGSKEVTDAPERIKRVKFADLFPAGSQAKLVRQGMVNCHAAVCEFVFEF